MPRKTDTSPAVHTVDEPIAELRAYRNSRLYRSLTRTLRVYNRRLIEGLHERGFTDFSPAFPSMLSNLDTRGTPIGVLAARAGVTRQAAGQLLRQIADRGYVSLKPSTRDARVTVIQFTARGRRLLQTVFELVEEIEQDFGKHLGADEFERVRDGLRALADHIDQSGAFGTADTQEPNGAGAQGRRSPTSQ